MNRLTELDTTDPDLRRARDVVRAVRPLPASDIAMARVRRAVLASPPRRAWVGLPVLLAAALSLVAVGGLAAAGVRWQRARLAIQESTGRALNSAPVQPSARAVAVAAPLSAPVDDAAEPTSTPSPSPRRSPAKAHLFPTRPQASLDDVRKVHEAATALRRDGDAAGAARLLESIPSNTNSPLAEEALALRVEAAQARHSADLKTLASNYLKRYPNGRYAATARSALTASTP